jgi:hypothetical protein
MEEKLSERITFESKLCGVSSSFLRDSLWYEIFLGKNLQKLDFHVITFYVEVKPWEDQPEGLNLACHFILSPELAQEKCQILRETWEATVEDAEFFISVFKCYEYLKKEKRKWKS